MALSDLNIKKAANEGRRMRLVVDGITDKIFFTVLADEAKAVQDYIKEVNDKHTEEFGVVNRTPDQVKEFFKGRFAVQVTKVETYIVDPETQKETVREEIEVTPGEWLPAGEQLAKRMWEEDMSFVSDRAFEYAGKRSHFLPEKGKSSH